MLEVFMLEGINKCLTQKQPCSTAGFYLVKCLLKDDKIHRDSHEVTTLTDRHDRINPVSGKNNLGPLMVKQKFV